MDLRALPRHYLEHLKIVKQRTRLWRLFYVLNWNSFFAHVFVSQVVSHGLTSSASALPRAFENREATNAPLAPFLRTELEFILRSRFRFSGGVAWTYELCLGTTSSI